MTVALAQAVGVEGDRELDPPGSRLRSPLGTAQGVRATLSLPGCDTLAKLLALSEPPLANSQALPGYGNFLSYVEHCSQITWDPI